MSNAAAAPQELNHGAGALPTMCGRCGYDLRGLPPLAAACPECGEPCLRDEALALADRQLRFAVLLLCWALPLGLATWFLPTSIRLSGVPNPVYPLRHIWPCLLPVWGLALVAIGLLVSNPLVAMSAPHRRWLRVLIFSLLICMTIRAATMYVIPDSAVRFQPYYSAWSVEFFLSAFRFSVYPLSIAVLALSGPLGTALEKRAGTASVGFRVLHAPIAVAVMLGAVWLCLEVRWVYEPWLFFTSPPGAPVAAITRVNTPIPAWYVQLLTATRVAFFAANIAICMMVWFALMTWRASCPARLSREHDARS